MMPLWLTHIPLCDASVQRLVHGSSGIVSKSTLISGIKRII